MGSFHPLECLEDECPHMQILDRLIRARFDWTSPATRLQCSAIDDLRSVHRSPFQRVEDKKPALLGHHLLRQFCRLEQKTYYYRSKSDCYFVCYWYQIDIVNCRNRHIYRHVLFPQMHKIMFTLVNYWCILLIFCKTYRAFPLIRMYCY